MPRSAVAQRHWSDTARGLVMQMQRRALIERGFDPDEYQKRLQEVMLSNDTIDDFHTRFAAAMGTEPEYSKDLIQTLFSESGSGSPYEYGGYYQTIVEHAEAIETALQRIGVPLDVPPLFGTITSGRVNAMAINVPSTGEYIILFDGGMFTFCNLFGKIVSRCLPFRKTAGEMNAFSTDPRDLEATIASVPELRGRFIEVLKAYVVEGDPKRATPYLLQLPHMSVAQVIRSSMELFVLGHEYAHISRGHFDPTRDRWPGGEVSLDEQQKLWMDEIEADIKGFEAALDVQLHRDGLDLSLSYWGADFFFSCFDIVERCVSILRTGARPDPNRATGSHPPAHVRRTMLRAILHKSVGDQALHPIELAMRLEQVLERFWEQTEEFWFQLHRNGIRPCLVTD